MTKKQESAPQKDPATLAPKGQGWSEDLSLDIDAWYSPEVALQRLEPFQGTLESTIEWNDLEDLDDDGRPKKRVAYLFRLTEPFLSATLKEELVPLDAGMVLGVSHRAGLKVVGKEQEGTEFWVMPKEQIKLSGKRTTWKFTVRKRVPF